MNNSALKFTGREKKEALLKHDDVERKEGIKNKEEVEFGRQIRITCERKALREYVIYKLLNIVMKANMYMVMIDDDRVTENTKHKVKEESTSAGEPVEIKRR